jgi:hypothetical protein
MSSFSKAGIVLLILGLLMFGYQGISAFLGMGTSDEFVYENISFVDVLGEDLFSWTNSISIPSIRSLAETLVNAPIAVLMLGGSLVCFVIHAFRGSKYIK